MRVSKGHDILSRYLNLTCTNQTPRRRSILVVQLCLTLCDPMDCNPPASCVRGIFQAKYWSGLQCSSPGDLPNPGTEPGGSDGKRRIQVNNI